jgi:hypothetical protein
MKESYGNPEPVPPASQLAVLPFLAAVDGFLRDGVEVPGLRITVHRTMSRDGDGYLQQVCAYLGQEEPDWRGKVGRTFPVDIGIIGAAFKNGLIWRTKSYTSFDKMRPDLLRAMRDTSDERNPEDVAWSYLAMPILGPQREVVLILYAECKELNFFADDNRVRRVAAMCRGFCRLFDWLQRHPFPNLRNFPLQKGQAITGSEHRVYKGIQESVRSIEPPRFAEIASFNYEASVA